MSIISKLERLIEGEKHKRKAKHTHKPRTRRGRRADGRFKKR